MRGLDTDVDERATIPGSRRNPGTADGLYAFFDIDGTLVHRDKEQPNGVPSPAVAMALDAFVAAGGSCVLCTGRPRGLVVPEVLALPFSGCVTMDGAHVEMGGRVVRDVAIPPSLVWEALREMEALDISAIFESVELNVSLDRGENWFPSVPSPTTAEGVRALKPDLRFSKAVFHNHELQKFKESSFLRESFVLYHLDNGMIEVTVEGIDKGAGLLAYTAALPQPPVRTYAFGDSENDMPMLRAADVAVAMGNALPHVIELARSRGGFVTDPVLEDGVATFINKQILGLDSAR